MYKKVQGNISVGS